MKLAIFREYSRKTLEALGYFPSKVSVFSYYYRFFVEKVVYVTHQSSIYYREIIIKRFLKIRCSCSCEANKFTNRVLTLKTQLDYFSSRLANIRFVY